MASIVTHVQSCSQENCESFISPFPRHSYYNAGVQKRRPPRFLARSLGRHEPSLAVQHVFFRLGDRPRHRQHLGLRQRQRHCGQRTLDRSHQQEHRRGRGRRARGQGNAGAHAEQHRRHPPSERRRYRRLQGDGEDAELLHSEGPQPQDVRAPADRDRRAFGDHPGGEARRARLRHARQSQRSLSGRAGHDGGHRRRTSHHRAFRQHDRGHRRRHH